MNMNDHDSFRFDEGAAGFPDNNGHLASSPELAALAGRLDELATAERETMTAAFEDRLVGAVRAANSGVAAMDATPRLRMIAAPEPVQAVFVRRRFGALRVAAMVGIMVTVGAVWLGGLRGGAVGSDHEAVALANLEQDLDMWLSTPDILGEKFDAELAAIHAATADLAGDSSDTDTWGEEGSL